MHLSDSPRELPVWRSILFVPAVSDRFVDSALKGDAGNTYETPAATVFDAQASYRVGSVRLGLVLDNLTDRKYWVPSRYFGGGQVTPAPRRSVAATVSWQL